MSGYLLVTGYVYVTTAMTLFVVDGSRVMEQSGKQSIDY
jgi:hypothetical protein